MKPKKTFLQALLLLAAVLGLAFVSAQFAAAQQPLAPKPVTSSNATSPADKQAIGMFEDRVKQYLKLRSDVKEKVPKLSKDSTAEQIDAYRTAFVAALRAARANAKQGELFTPIVSEYIRRTLKAEFKGRDRKDIREIIFEAETAGVPLRVNHPYPVSVELAEMPSKLLLELPQLPKEVRFRFVGSNMLLVDRDNNLILDYMTKALP